MNNERLHKHPTEKGCVDIQKQHEYHLDYGLCILTCIHFYLWDTDEEVVDSIINSGKTQMLHGDTCQTLLFGSGLDVKLWPYAFMHILHICNALPGKEKDVSPLFLSIGQKNNFQNKRLFVC